MIIVRSSAFSEGHTIPAKHTADGGDVSPPLSWSQPPKGTVELALLLDDPDAPGEEPWVHWVLTAIPGETRELPEGFHGTTAPEGAPVGLIHGKNSWGTLGYRGPQPPREHGVHHYHIKIFALDAPLSLEPGVDKHTLLEAVSGHVLARGELVGVYQR
jgi:Raf kinase inhibitor-like YbhB/YbcL family protein